MTHSKNTSFRMLLIAILCFWCSIAHAEIKNSPAYLSHWLQKPQLTFGSQTIDTNLLHTAYKQNKFRPLWIDAEGLNSHAHAVMQTIARADQHGLNPRHYGIDNIRRISSYRPNNADDMVRRNLSLELLLSHSIVRYTQDLQNGSTKRQWDTGAPYVNAAQTMTDLYRVAQAPNPLDAMESLAPQTPEYNALKASYMRHKKIAKNGGWPTFQIGKKLAPTMQDNRVTQLRDILISQGDLMPGNYPTNKYDPATVEAVKHFQARHGIQADGVIGPATQQKLNMSVEECIKQIALTLERMRWMSRDLGNRYVMVNVPAYKLKAVAYDKELRMDVIVGSTKNKTPMFSKEITNVVLNPTWSVPSSIARKEMLPKAIEDPSFLDRSNFKIIDQWGQQVSPYAIDWHNATQDNFPYKFRQNAGGGNALGKVKFMIPNSGSIFLHDTSQPRLFSRSQRNLSHGCIRLSNPKAMTQFVLNSEGWSEDKINSTYERNASRHIKIEPLPVHLVYWTAWVDEKGRTRFNSDIYNMNTSLAIAMQRTPKNSGVLLAMK